MTWAIPTGLEDAIYAATRGALGDAALATPNLTRAIVDRSRRYTSERDRLSAPVDRSSDLAARAVFFTIADAMKIAIPLAELANRSALPAARPLRVVDLGAGCGAMLLGLIASVGPDTALDVVAIDRDADALGIARTAVADFAARRNVPLKITTRGGDAATVAIPPADLVVLGTVLNELPEPVRLPLIRRALAALSPDGAVIIIEPALRETSRDLHTLRDAVLALGDAHVFAPCTRTGPCPALIDPDDWCHEDRNVTLPPRTAELARLTHLRDGGLRFSYLVLRREPLAVVAEPGAWRMVSAPKIQKGKHEIIGCNASGRVTLRLLKRHRVPENRVFEDARRGDVLIVESATAAAEPPSEPSDRLDIVDTMRVKRVTPARR